MPDKIVKVNFEIMSLTCVLNGRRETIYSNDGESCLNVRTTAIIRVDENDKRSLNAGLKAPMRDLQKLDGQLLLVDGWQILVKSKCGKLDEKMEAFLKGNKAFSFQRLLFDLNGIHETVGPFKHGL